MPQERLPSLLCASGEFWNSPSNVGRQEMVYQFGSIEFFLLSNKLIHSATTVACSITGTRRFIWRSQWSTHPSYVFCLSMDVIKCWAYQIAEILTTKSSTYPPYTESSNKQMKPVSQISLCNGNIWHHSLCQSFTNHSYVSLSIPWLTKTWLLFEHQNTCMYVLWANGM